jgi:hypothetical protein
MAADTASGRKAKGGTPSMKVTSRKPANAFATARKGFCYLTIKSFGRNHEMMRIRAYKIEPDEKRHMRRLYPDVTFDWKKITQQLAEKREDCRRYRSRRQGAAARRASWDHEPVLGVYEPSTRTIYASGIPSSTAGIGRLLDAIVQLDRERSGTPFPQGTIRKPAEPGPVLAQDGKPSKL